MTHAEVEQLKRNYEEFRKLSPERRKALEELDDEVRQDSSGHLLKLLTGYNRWLSGLSPFDQERVLSKTDPIERAQLVKTIREEQKKRQALAAIDAVGRPAAMLQPADLDAMLKAVEENFLTPESRKNVPDQLAGRERHLRILKAAQLQVRASDDSTGAAQTLVSTLIEAVPNESVKNRIMNPPRARTRRQVLGQVLSRSLVNEWCRRNPGCLSHGLGHRCRSDQKVGRSCSRQARRTQEPARLETRASRSRQSARPGNKRSVQRAATGRRMAGRRTAGKARNASHPSHYPGRHADGRGREQGEVGGLTPIAWLSRLPTASQSRRAGLPSWTGRIAEVSDPRSSVTSGLACGAVEPS